LAISAQEVRSAEPSSKFVLALAGAMLAILCVLVLVVAALNSGGTTRATTTGHPAAVSAGQGSGGETDSQPTFGPLP
jgi:hypothetical protein